jgi:hypothetical protein
MYKRISIAALVFLFVEAVFCQEVMLTPSEYVMPMDKGSKKLDNAPGTDYWMVFSDRANNAWYSDASCTRGSEKGSQITFMQPFLVLGVSPDGKALNVVENTFIDEFGRGKANWQQHTGWILKDNLLLSNRCLKTTKTDLPGFTSGIFNKKALVLNTIREGEKYSPPTYFSDPVKRGAGDIRALALVYQINFVYKETDSAYLLGEDESINPDDLKFMKGWVLQSKTTPWNHNLAFETNWDAEAVTERKAKKLHAWIFEQEIDAPRYYCQGIKEGFGHVPYKERDAYYTQRAVGEIDRFPALNYYPQSKIWELGVVGHLIDKDGNKLDPDTVGKAFDIIDKVQKEVRKVNIVFVIDATTSILDYRDFIINAVETTIDNLNKEEQKTYRFGVALYRDAPEEKDFAFQAMSELVPEDRISSLSTWLKNNMIPSYNKCDTDLPEAVFYGIKQAVTHFNLKAGQSNFVILVGDCGNHNRDQYNGCGSGVKDDFTKVSLGELTDVLAKNDVNLLSYQVHHKDDKSYDDFCEQSKEIIFQTAKKRKPSIDSTFLISPDPLTTKMNKKSGMAYQVKCTDQTLSTTSFQQEISGALEYIDTYVDEIIKALVEILRSDDYYTKFPDLDINMIANVLSKLSQQGITRDQLKIIINKNGQLYWQGYTMQDACNFRYPIFQDVLLTNHKSLYYIKYALEKLIPTNEFCMGTDKFRSYLQITWEEILVKQLKYFSENSDQINDLTLYDLSAILTGWGGKEKYKEIKFRDIVDPVKFPNDQLYEYLIDWMITKGHIQSIFEGRNMLTKNYFSDHIACYAMEYIMYSTGNYFEDSEYYQIETELIDKFTAGFQTIGAQYSKVPKFRIPIGEAENAAETYYWNDSRIFPHLEEINRSIVFYEDVLKEYIDKYYIEEGQ